MGKTITIRNLEDEVYLALKRHAESAGISIPERLRRHIRLMALGGTSKRDDEGVA